MNSVPVLYKNPEALSLLASIRERPDDDTARLVFADWLDESTGSDPGYETHYMARSQFIRCGCENIGKSLARQNQKESAWLKENWKLLFPNLVAMNDPNLPVMEVAGGKDHTNTSMLRSGLSIKGREIPVRITQDWDYNIFGHCVHAVNNFTCNLSVRRGFVTNIKVWIDVNWTVLVPAILQDDPLAPVPRYPYTHRSRWAGKTEAVDSFNVGNPDIFNRLRPDQIKETGQRYNPKVALYHHEKSDFHNQTSARVNADVDRATREWADEIDVMANMEAKKVRRKFAVTRTATEFFTLPPGSRTTITGIDFSDGSEPDVSVMTMFTGEPVTITRTVQMEPDAYQRLHDAMDRHTSE